MDKINVVKVEICRTVEVADVKLKQQCSVEGNTQTPNLREGETNIMSNKMGALSALDNVDLVLLGRNSIYLLFNLRKLYRGP